MKGRVIRFFTLYGLWVLLFAIQKPLFMALYPSFFAGIPVANWLNVVIHGLVLDLSMAAYLTVFPGLFLLLSVWTERSWLYKVARIYFGIAATLISLAFVANLALYEYWGFPLDSTPLFYLFSSPKAAFASVSIGYILLGVGAFALYAYLVYRIMRACFRPIRTDFKRWGTTFMLLLLTGLLFIPIRGGVTVGTNNTGKAFFSDNMRLNHAAVNPLFSFFESVSHQENFAEQYRFMPADEAQKIFRDMQDRSIATPNIPPKRLCLLNTTRPNVVIVILESFSSKLMGELGGRTDVAVNLDRIARKGVLFTRFYANSFRTDRGLVAVLSGYPAQPTMSIMKYPHKTASLPSIAQSLRRVGYNTRYFYGGDADFTNMRSYLVSSGFQDIISDTDFPLSSRMSKWGVADHLVFRRLLDDIRADHTDKPMLRVLQTSSSHEPFDVPYKRLSDIRLNAFAYTDDCVGRFVAELRRLPAWKNTLIVLVPDHLGAYPENIDNLSLERFQIPLILSGGAVKKPCRLDVIGSQQDIAATLLAQLGVSHKAFLFSKDMTDASSPHFAFFTIPDAFGLVTDDNQLIYDNQSGRIVVDNGAYKGTNLRKGQAYLQTLYDDIAHR